MMMFVVACRYIEFQEKKKKGRVVIARVATRYNRIIYRSYPVSEDRTDIAALSPATCARFAVYRFDFSRPAHLSRYMYFDICTGKGCFP